MTNTDALTGKLLQVVDQVQDTVSAHGAEAVNLMLTTVSIDGAIKLGMVFILLIIAAFVGSLSFKCLNTNIGKKSTDTDCFVFLLALVVITISFIYLIYPWSWIHAFNPKLYLAHQIIGKVLS